MASSWWTAPDVQGDRAAFRAAVAAKAPEWRERESEITRLMARLQTPDYMVGTPKRAGFSTGRIQVSA